MDCKISITATFSAEPVAAPVRAWCQLAGCAATVEVLPYNQVYQSLLADQPTDLMVVAIRWDDWGDEVPTSSSIREMLEIRRRELTAAISRYLQTSSNPVLLIFTPMSPSAGTELVEAAGRVEASLRRHYVDSPQINVISSGDILSPEELSTATDFVALKTGHVPYTAQYFSIAGQQIAREWYRRSRPLVKVVVVDADNTLWGGVCGEDSHSALRVTDGHRALQERLLELRKCGLLLSLCSKNEPSDVWAAMQNVPGMLLSRSDFTTSRVNWRPKSENIREIASELNLHPSSFVFLDDSPIECGEVRAACPDVITLRIPSAGLLKSFVRRAWPLDTPNTTKEDAARTERYKDERLRNASLQQSVSLEDFLQQLDLEVAVESISTDTADRAAQLMQRTNQFNTTGLKLSAAELLRSPAELKLIVGAKDKFGDYGNVGLALGHVDADNLHIDGLWLSCRALGRGVEFELVRQIASLADSHGCIYLQFNLTATERNTPAQNFVHFIATRFAQGSSNPSQTDSLTGVRLPASQLRQLSANECAAACISAASSQPASPTHPATTSANSIALQHIIEASSGAHSMHQFVRSTAAARPESHEAFVEPETHLELSICDICAEVLHLREVGLNDSLVALGGGSLHAVQIHSRLTQQIGASLSITQLYSLATIRDIVQATEAGLAGDTRPLPQPRLQPAASSARHEPIAVIGMAGRFPGAGNVQEFWDNLVAGRCSIVDIPEHDLNLETDHPLRSNPNLVRRSAGLADVSGFDAKFFKIYPKEAAVMDPQHRLLLESSWHAIEDAGYIPDEMESRVGVFAGCYMNTYMLASLAENPTLVQSLADSFHGGDLHTELGNDKDYLATRIAYLLNLRGPALTIQTACSTSLVAIAYACQCLRSDQCDFALAGGATLKLPQNRGYLYTDGGMVSPDGVVRTFDADARGTVFGEGVGVVALKRLCDAKRDGDDIYAVIKGFGINNDGRQKMGYAAPSVDGQAAAVSLALEDAGVPSDTITYVEAHGTGTSLGDPIEIDALSRAYRWHGSAHKNQYCAVGSLKTNIGHLDVAAGVTGLIKVCMAMRHGQIPASLNYSRPNPNIDFANSPFFVNTQLREWKPTDHPLRAGLSSFGVGGTNAHIVIEQAPSPDVVTARCARDTATPTLLTWSAATEQALHQATDDLHAHLHRNQSISIEDVAYTLATGRKTLNYSFSCVARTRDDAIRQLASKAKLNEQKQVRRGIATTWLFPGQGAQHPAMAQDLYNSMPNFRQYVDQCSDLLSSHLGFVLADYLRKPNLCPAEQFNQTSIAQPAIFAVSYALAKCLMDLGIRPVQMVGHSVGEFVAATIAGVFKLEDALSCVAFRGKSMQALPEGDMLAVRVPPEQLKPLLPRDIDLAAVNSPQLCVVSGPKDAVLSFAQLLESQDFAVRSLHTSHAFHSSMMQPVVATLKRHMSGLELQPPEIPIVSTLTGQPLTDAEATSPSYWARHLRETVRFSDAVAHALHAGETAMVEVGPGQTLSTLVKQCVEPSKKHLAISLLPHAKQTIDAYEHLLLSLGKLWQSGVDFDRSALLGGSGGRRIHLPGYPFQHERHWFDSVTAPINVDSELEDTQPAQSNVFAPEPAPAAAPSPASQQPTARQPASNLVHQVVQEQLDLMTRQLKTWRG